MNNDSMSIYGRNSKIWHRSQKTITCTRHERDPNLDLLKKLNETSTYMTDDSMYLLRKKIWQFSENYYPVPKS